MGFKCNICKEHAQEKTNKLTTQIRKVVYNTPCRDITDYNNSDKITIGSEIVKEINCCSKCFKEHEKDSPNVIGDEKQIYVKKKEINKKNKQDKRNSNKYNNDDSLDDENELQEKYE